MLGFLIAAAITGLVVGALGRLAIPGPNPMSIPMTIAVGVGGSLLAAVIFALLTDGDRAPGLIFSVLGAALIVWLLQRNQPRRSGYDRS